MFAVAALDTQPTLLSLSSLPNPNPRHFLPLPSYKQILTKSSLNSIQIPNPKPLQITPSNVEITRNRPVTVADKLNSLASEFKSLPEPIDRVKHLLHYASLLPEFDPSCRTEMNRVKGCTAQVWLEARLENSGAMRFSVDSDSEITKGFCFCLIWLLDGAAAGDVLGLDIDDLGEMNVGVTPISRVSSRVNTWHNVLIGMKKRTKDLIMARDAGKEPPSRFKMTFPSGGQISPKESCSEAQEALKLMTHPPVHAQVYSSDSLNA